MFRKEIRDEIEILASPEEVWKALTDFEGFRDWNPFIRPVVGQAVEGARLRVQIRPPGGRAVAFQPKVTKVAPNRELRWKGRLWVSALLDGEHIFEIEPLGPERSRFVQREVLSGLLVPLMAKSIDQTLAGFGEMNRALKERIEGGRRESIEGRRGLTADGRARDSFGLTSSYGVDIFLQPK